MIMMMRILGIVTMNRILWIHFGYFSLSGNGGFGFFNWQELLLEILSPELGWKIQRVVVTVHTALQRGGQRPSQSLSPCLVQVSLDVLVNHLRHCLTAGLALLASLPRPHLEVVVLVAVPAVAAVEAVGQGLS